MPPQPLLERGSFPGLMVSCVECSVERSNGELTPTVATQELAGSHYPVGLGASDGARAVGAGLTNLVVAVLASLNGALVGLLIA